MTILTGTTVNWTLSPRIITISSTYTDITVTDLHETLLALEDDEEGVLWPHLRATSGGEALGGGVTVGVTVELQNAQVAFQERVTPLQSGTATSNTSPTADGFITLTDTAASFQTNLVGRGDLIINVTDGSQCTVVSVTDENNLIATALAGGTDNDFDIGDSYDIYDVVQCTVTGGNLVAIDGVGAELSPIFTTFGTQVVRTASSSATLQQQSEIQQASFGNSVTIDVVSGTAGTAYPIGRDRLNAVNNLADAKTILTARGFDRLEIIGDLTLGSGENLDDLIVTGEGATFNTADTTLTMASSSSIEGAHLMDMRVEGTQSGEAIYENCVLGNITAAHCMYRSCLLVGPFQWATGAWTNTHQKIFENCYTNDNEVTIDYNGSGLQVVFTNFKGNIAFTNMTNANAHVKMQMDGGHVHLQASCTAGTIELDGTGELENETGGTLVHADGLSTEAMNNARLAVEFTRLTHQGVGVQIFVDPQNGLAGNDGHTVRSAVATYAQAEALAVSGGNDIITFINPSSATYNHFEDIVIAKDNVHLRAASRSITFLPASTGGSVVTVNGTGCSLAGLLIDGDKMASRSANTAANCLTLNGNFTRCDSVWTTMSTSSCVLIRGGEFHVFTDLESNMAGSHGVELIDADLASGSPRQITITGRTNIHMNGGNGLHIGADAGDPVNTTTRMIRFVSGNCSHNTGYGIEIEAQAYRTMIGNDVMMHDNTAGRLLDNGDSTSDMMMSHIEMSWNHDLTTGYTAGMQRARELLLELSQVFGLDAANPMTVTPTSRTTGSVSQTITGDGSTTSTVTRQ